MEMQFGLFDRIVLQRDGEGFCHTDFGGTAEAEGALTVRVSRERQVLQGFEGVVIGEARGGSFRGTLAGLPTGGPYDIDLAITDAAGTALVRWTIAAVLVGEVWILGGQSNMQGVGHREHAPQPDPAVRALYMDDRWDMAADPIHVLRDAIDPVHLGTQASNVAAHQIVGPGVAFGLARHRRTGYPQGLIACAHGATRMEQWDPGRKALGGRSLYGSMLRRFTTHGRRVAGVLFYQGESDAAPEYVTRYSDRVAAMVAAMREDFGDAELPVVLTQIGRLASGGFPRDAWNAIQEQQRRLAQTVPRLVTVPTIDLELDDNIHIGGRGQKRLGARYDDAMATLTHRDHAGVAPITLAEVTVEKNRASGFADIVVTFDNVAGNLQSGSRPMGFSLVRGDQPALGIFDTQLQGCRAILRTQLTAAQLEDKVLYYGFGLDPSCNITDGADRAVPVFGPVAVAPPRAVSPFYRNVRLSGVMPRVGSFEEIDEPVPLETLHLRRRRFDGDFLDVRELWTPDENQMVYYAAAFETFESMRLSIGLGYDGPVKVWINGDPRYHDPGGTNPAMADAARIEYRAEPGHHEILVALGSNAGLAWGIYLRIERLDVDKELILRGRDHYTMPIIEG